MNLDEAEIRAIDARIAAAMRKRDDYGTIVQRDSVGPGALVVLDGPSGAAVPVKVLGHVHAFENDRVVLNLVKDRWVVIGSFSRVGLGNRYGRGYGPNPSGTKADNAFADVPAGAGAVDIIKRYDDTDIEVNLVTTMWATVANTEVETGVRISGQPGTETATTFTALDYLVGAMNIQNTFVRATVFGFMRTDIPAGAYLLTPRWRRTAGTGTLALNEDDIVVIYAHEVLNSTGGN